jgi:serine/threonine protein kinase
MVISYTSGCNRMTMGRSGDELIGKTLGTFEIVEEIGRGGMATVYRARQVTMNRVVAVKVLPRHLLHDPSFFERFEREVEVISHLEHPHIVPIYEYGQTEGIPYIAMRYLGGGSLETIIRKRLPALSELEKPLRQIAQALDYAHQQGIIHRDLKPGNIMFDENNNAYLSDFGIARVLGSNMTGSMIVGTPAYMSPEQANGLPIDGRSDIYALGVVLFEMLTGREPYQAETPMAVLLKHINEPMPPVRDYREDVPYAVDEVVQKSTSKDPDDRYPSASMMVEALSAALRQPVSEAYGAPTMKKNAPKTPSAGIQGVPNPMIPPAQPAYMPTPAPMPNPTGQMVATTTGTMQAPPAGTASRLIIVLLLAVIVIGSGIFAFVLTSRSPTIDPAHLVPTAFPRAATITGDNYTISMLNNWIPPTMFTDLSDDYRQSYSWQEVNAQAFVTLSLVEIDVTSDAGFRAAMAAYHERYYLPQNVRLLDEDEAEDGTVRRSYRLETASQFPPGQLDVFYQRRAPYLVVIETYTSDASGNTLVPDLQRIYDSFRLKPPQPNAG